MLINKYYYFTHFDNISKSDRRKFYNKLKSIKDKFSWVVTKDGRVRAKLRSKYYCPITAIAKHVSGKRYNMCDAKLESTPVGFYLDETSRQFIEIASDNEMSEINVDESKSIRKTILNILGL